MIEYENHAGRESRLSLAAYLRRLGAWDGPRKRRPSGRVAPVFEVALLIFQWAEDRQNGTSGTPSGCETSAVRVDPVPSDEREEFSRRGSRTTGRPGIRRRPPSPSR